MKETRQDIWAQKFSEYQRALNRFFRRRHLHRHDAEDLAQEVYLRLLRAEQTEAGAIRNPEAYVFTVAVNLLRERAAIAARGSPAASIEEIEDRFLAVDPGTEDEIERIAREQRLAAVVNSLPPKFRAVIVMHYTHGLSYQEMAKRIGVSPNTIKKYVGQALRLCRRQLRLIEGDRP